MDLFSNLELYYSTKMMSKSLLVLLTQIYNKELEINLGQIKKTVCKLNWLEIQKSLGIIIMEMDSKYTKEDKLIQKIGIKTISMK